MSRARKSPRLLTVADVESLGGVVQRVSFCGEELRDFPVDRNGSHIKIFFPRPWQDVPVLPVKGANGPVMPPADIRPITRTYSVRKYCEKSQRLVVDFVLHGADAPASGWAKRAKPGHVIGIAGPGGPNPLLPKGQWHIIAGDLTAFPAISALLEEMPRSAQGYVFIEIEQDQSPLNLVNNTNMQLRWLVREKGNVVSPQVAAIQTVLPLGQSSELSAFIAGENSAVINVRDYLIQRYGLTKKSMYAIPYWRRGKNEEAYHQQRHKIMDEIF